MSSKSGVISVSVVEVPELVVVLPVDGVLSTVATCSGGTLKFGRREETDEVDSIARRSLSSVPMDTIIVVETDKDAVVVRFGESGIGKPIE